MKICVLGDSHGAREKIERVLALERPHKLLFLGDGERDLPESSEAEVISVAGNCDLGSRSPLLRLIQAEGKRILLLHGHKYAVKRGLYDLIALAKQKSADVALFGHTHVAAAFEQDGILFLNPGSLGFSGGYLVLALEGGRLAHTFKAL